MMAKYKCFMTTIFSLMLMLSLCGTGVLGVIPVYAASVDEVQEGSESLAGAAYQSQTSVTNRGRVGVVDIVLNQSFPSDVTTIIPNQTVDIKTSITNQGQDSWLRVKIEYPVSEDSMTDEMTEPLMELNDSLIAFADDRWEKIGAYYYLKEPVVYGQEVPFTESITFPVDWDNRMVRSEFGMVFTAEAIQQKNFEPDFMSEDPWFGAVIEAFDATDYSPKAVGTENFQVSYEGGAEGLIHLGDDFFANWGDVMPGDVLEGHAEIVNHMNLPVKLYFSMENTGDADLLSQMHLVLQNGEDVVYDGVLSENLLPEVLLREYGEGETTDFTYILSLSEDVDNTHALADFISTWTFLAEEVDLSEEVDGPGVTERPDEPDVPDEKPDAPKPDAPKDSLPDKVMDKLPEPVKQVVRQIQEQIDTGDVMLTSLIGVALGMLVVLMILSVKSKHMKKGGRQ